MKVQHMKENGFTIVELLIVIVVIGILASISIVAYNGVQSRANDSVLKSDLSNFGKKMEIAASENNGTYVAGGAIRAGGGGGNASGNPIYLPGFTFPASRSSYDASINNFYYCSGIETASSQPSFVVFAKSRSGKVFQYINGSVSDLGTTASTAVDTRCRNSNTLNAGFSWSYGYQTSGSAWNDWVK